MPDLHFSFPAQYRRHVEAELERLLAEIGRDLTYRDDEDPRIAKWAPVPDTLIDPTATGRLRILFNPECVPAPATGPSATPATVLPFCTPRSA